jgi:hypothetical protein
VSATWLPANVVEAVLDNRLLTGILLRRPAAVVNLLPPAISGGPTFDSCGG